MSQRSRRYVRQMPKMYGNLHRPPRDWSRIKRALRLTAFCSLGLFIAYGLFFGPFFRVRSIDVRGAKFSDIEAVKKVVPLGGSIWTLPREQVLKAVASDPLIQDVTLMRGIPSTVRIVVSERTPSLLWTSGNFAYLVDADGIPFRQYDVAALPDPASPVGQAIASLPHIVDTAAVPVKLGSPVIGRGILRFYASVRGDFASYLPALHIDRAEVGDTTYDLSVRTVEGMTVTFDVLGDAGVQMRNLTRLVNQSKVDVKASKVDLRIDRWAYVSQ